MMSQSSFKTSLPKDKPWDGQTAYLLGGGPSLKKYLPDANILKGKNVIALNNAYKIAPWAEVLLFADACWYEWHKDTMFDTFQGDYIVSGCWASTAKFSQDVIRIKKESNAGIDMRIGKICGNNVGHQGVNLAMQLGAKELVLIGYDMTIVKGESHWHKEHKRESRQRVYDELMLPNFQTVPEHTKQHGVKVWNVNPDSALKCFPFKPIEELL